MSAGQLEDLALRLFEVVRRPFEPAAWFGLLVPTLLRLLARGRPVTPDAIAAATGVDVADVRRRLRSMPDAELDDDGNLVGMGLTLRPTPHVFTIGGRRLYTWCALDTLIYPPLLGVAASIESPCRATGESVRLETGPEGVRRVEPAEAVVSIVIPDECCGTIRAAFCNEVHFFRSREAAADWLEHHPEALLLTVRDAFELGRLLNEASVG